MKDIGQRYIFPRLHFICIRYSFIRASGFILPLLCHNFVDCRPKLLAISKITYLGDKWITETTFLVFFGRSIIISRGGVVKGIASSVSNEDIASTRRTGTLTYSLLKMLKCSTLPTGRGMLGVSNIFVNLDLRLTPCSVVIIFSWIQI